MTEAVRAAIPLAFRHAPVQRLVSSTHPDNHASQNLLRKCGFRNIGMQPRLESALRGPLEEAAFVLPRADYAAAG